MTSKFLKFIRKVFLCIPSEPGSNEQDMQEEDRNPLVRDAPVTSFPSRSSSLQLPPPPVTETVDEAVASVPETASESKEATTSRSRSGTQRSYEDEDGDENAPSTSGVPTIDITTPQESLPGADDRIREPESMPKGPRKTLPFRSRGRSKAAKPSPTPTEDEESEETTGVAAKDGLYGRPSKPFSSSSTTSKPKPKPKP